MDCNCYDQFVPCDTDASWLYNLCIANRHDGAITMHRCHRWCHVWWSHRRSHQIRMIPIYTSSRFCDWHSMKDDDGIGVSGLRDLRAVSDTIHDAPISITDHERMCVYHDRAILTCSQIMDSVVAVTWWCDSSCIMGWCVLWCIIHMVMMSLIVLLVDRASRGRRHHSSHINHNCYR